ncbi:VanZ family protein [Roseovarius tibetensis]|uniref:VanZ family protein n=1 Tax=Roseovarius tibetensis TaxID=2685897 RepID=UPI003D7F8D4C
MAHAATLALALIIASLTLAPLPPGPPGIPGLDKIAHLSAFAVLVAPLAWKYPRHWMIVAVAATCYGGIIEVVQPYVGRGMEFADLLADAAGAVAGSCIASRIGARRRIS